MKKIINNHQYNTHTAKEIAKAVQVSSDLYEALYQSRAGRYFLHGQGSGCLRYGTKRCTGNEGIYPLTRKQAVDWATRHMGTLVAGRIFDEGANDYNKKKVGIYLTGKTRAKLERIKSETGRSLSTIIEGILAKHL